MNDIDARKQALSLGFDYNCYLQNNPDLVDKWDHDLATHFILYGMNEGRIFQCPETSVQPQTTDTGTGTDAGTNTDPNATPQPTNNNNKKLALLGIAAGLAFIAYKEKLLKLK